MSAPKTSIHLRARGWELAVSEIVHERRPREVRILLWREDAVTIAYANRATHLPG